jgi:hypothetical protein
VRWIFIAFVHEIAFVSFGVKQPDRLAMGATNRKSNVTDDQADEAIEGLGTTVGSFASRLQQQLKEKEQRESHSQKQTSERHSRMLQAMNTIRRALQETCKIKLGSRFSLDLDVSDWKGWPRLELFLVDCHAPERKDYCLVVTAHDRQKRGAVEMHAVTGKLMGELELKDGAQQGRLPNVLKRTVRDFLDEVAEYVLDPKKPGELVETESAPISLDTNEYHNSDVVSQQLAGEDLFTDELRPQNDNVLSTEADLDPLQLQPFEDNQPVTRGGTRDNRVSKIKEIQPLDAAFTKNH